MTIDEVLAVALEPAPLHALRHTVRQHGYTAHGVFLSAQRYRAF